MIIAFCLIFWKEEIFSFHYGNALSRLCNSISFALVITAQAITKTESKLNLKNLTFANKWGKYTYAIYLLHPIAITIIDIAVRVSHYPKTSFISVFSLGVLAFILTMYLSKLSYKYFESPFLKLKGKFSVIITR